jgi:sialic acid synthase SpsE
MRYLTMQELEPISEESGIELTEYFDIKFIEIHSVSFKDKNLFSRIESNNIPLILGIGGRTLDEISEVVDKYSNRNITLMVGFQSFPSELEDIKIGRIKELINLYPGCTIGYADHSSYDNEMAVASNEYAYVLGARVFEKHIAVEEGKERIDFQSAVGTEKLTSIRLKLEFLDKILSVENSDLFEMNDKEIAYRNRQKIPVAKCDLMSGHVLSSGDIVLKMLDQKEAVENLEELLGKKIIKNINVDSAFDKKDLQ